MILSYSKDRFVDQIKDGRKKHTIRADPKRRWKPGMKIQHWRGNPRNVKQNPYQFAEGECMSVQEVWIIRDPVAENGVSAMIGTWQEGRWLKSKYLKEQELLALAENDSLSIEEFREWFLPPGEKSFLGRIIHFTDLVY